MKIYEIAKSLNLKSSDLIKILNDNGFEVRSHNSNVEDDAIAFILKTFTKKAETAPEDKIDVKPQQETAKEEAEKTIEKKEEKQIEEQTIQRPIKKTFTEKPIQKTYEKPVENREEKPNEFSQAEKRSTDKFHSSNTKPANRDQNYGNSNNTRDNQHNTNASDNRSSQNSTGTYNNRNNQNSTGTNNNRNSQNSTGTYNNRNDQNSTGTYNNRNSQNTTGTYNSRNGQNNAGTSNNRSNQSTTGTYNNRNSQNSTGTYNRNNQNQNNQGTYNRDNQNNTGNNNRDNQSNTGTYNRDNQNNAGNNMRDNQRNSGNGNRDNQYNNGNNNQRNNFNKNKNNKNYKNNKANNQPKKDPNRKGAFIMPQPVVVEVAEDEIKTITIPETLTIKELADKMKTPAAALVKKLFLAGKMVSINQEITFDEAEEIAIDFGFIAEVEEKINVIEELLKETEEDASKLKKRPPVVCVMGHVDHGKTSLLDAIRESHVTEKEAGGITQHIGAYVVNINGESITFLDTPGHEAFTSMRMRGAQSTDIAILVVAADDGVMPQTIEAISHAKAAGVEIIVAINKIDKPSANIERVKQELVEYELIAEDWGGDTVFVPVSAHTKDGIDQLLEMITLTAEVCELKANPDRLARGIVIEAQLDKGRGPVATILVQKGTLHVGDPIAIGSAYGKIRAMMDDKGRRVKEAKPSTPVEILGLNEVPDAGEVFMVTENEKEARNIAEAYIKQGREKLLDDTKSKLSLDGLFSQIQAGNVKDLNLIIKADVQGSVEAVKQSLQKLSNEEVAIRIIHGGVGSINESDVSLASASNAIIIGFNVRPDSTAKDIADREKVDLRLYKVIYNAIEDIEAAMKGMLDPVFEEKVIGHAEIRQVFKASGLGSIAGSYVLDGKIVRNSKARISREGEVIFDGPIASVKRFKDDVKEVAAGYECGLVFEKFNDVKEEDQVEVYIMEEVPR
jgi:translation initiation factor IF-2